jgi:hypothetical protein
MPRGRLAIFDTQDERWTCHESLLKGLESFRKGPKRPDLDRHFGVQPVYSDDGHIAFEFWQPYKLYYFNGKEWKGFLWADFGGGRLQEVFFAESGALTVNTESRERGREGQPETWEYRGEEGWHQVEQRPAPESVRRNRWNYHEAFGEPRATLDTVVKDARGIPWNWHVASGQLYKRGMGLSAPQFLPGEAHPFIMEHADVTEVLPDQYGNFWLRSLYSEYVLLKPRAPLPDTEITVSPDAPDAVTVSLSCRATGEPWYVHRLDKGPWGKPRKDSRFRITELSAGTHRLEVFAIDPLLQVEPECATVEIGINVAADEQIAGWIAQLTSDDYEEREAAVKALGRQGDEALAALKKARQDANDDLKWWIDAAIQKWWIDAAIQEGHSRTDQPVTQ